MTLNISFLERILVYLIFLKLILDQGYVRFVTE